MFWLVCSFLLALITFTVEEDEKIVQMKVKCSIFTESTDSTNNINENISSNNTISNINKEVYI
jgi:hypothetical protein